MSVMSSALCERQIFHFCLDHPDKLLDLRDNYFLSGEGRDLYDALMSLYRDNARLTDENVVATGNRTNPGITADLMAAVRATPYDEGGWEHYRRLLREEYAKDRIQTRLLKDSLSVVSSKGELDSARLQDIVCEMQECINLAEGRDSAVKSIGEMFDSYQSALARRIDGSAFYPTGCTLLDSALPTGFAPGEITTIFGSTGIGKSTYSLYLINRMVNKLIPCFYVSLEMSETATMDRWMASRLRVPLRELYSKKGGIDESIVEQVALERRKLERDRRFMFIDDTRASVSSLEKMVDQVKLKLRTDYLVVFVDLATMLDDFSGGKPQDYELAMNALHQMVKRTGCHLVMVVQAVNKALENHRPASPDGVGVFRPILSSIKNSGAIAERSRTVLSVFRAHHYNAKFFPDDPLVKEESDVMEVQVLKSSNGETGQIVRYLYDGPLFRVYPIPDDARVVTAAGMARERADGGDDGEI